MADSVTMDRHPDGSEPIAGLTEREKAIAAGENPDSAVESHGGEGAGAEIPDSTKDGAGATAGGGGEPTGTEAQQNNDGAEGGSQEGAQDGGQGTAAGTGGMEAAQDGSWITDDAKLLAGSRACVASAQFSDTFLRPGPGPVSPSHSPSIGTTVLRWPSWRISNGRRQ